MSSEHPFQQLFETFGKPPEAHSETVNRAAREMVKAWLDAPVGRAGHCILLKAPRAGHGKTHLLTRLQFELSGSHEFIPLHAIGGSRIDAVTVLEDSLRRLVRGLPGGGGMAVLDLVARRLFSSSLQPLVKSGEVPCQDREAALVALRERPIETFDFHHPGAVTAHWAKENFELLGPRLALELSQRHGLPLREVSFWVDAMFRFAATAVDHPGRVRALAAHVFEGPDALAAAHERLVALLGLLSSLLRVVLVADELEGFSLDETAALRFASFIGSLRQSVECADIILSVNQDVWESAFLPRLSGGLADRLSEVTVEIQALDRAGMIALIESRAPGHGERIVGALGASYARGVIREAAALWNDPQGAAPEISAVMESAPSFEVPPAVFVEAPAAVFEAPVVSSAPVYSEPPAPAVAPAEVVSHFSPEAAIAAFKSFPDPFGAPEAEAPPAPAAFVSENAWPTPDVSVPSVMAPAQDFSQPPLQATVFQPAAEEPASPFLIDTAALAAAPSFQAPPAPAPVSPPFEAAAFQPPPAAAEHAFEASPVASTEPSNDRVDDLLRQFRERYGKS